MNCSHAVRLQTQIGIPLPAIVRLLPMHFDRRVRRPAGFLGLTLPNENDTMNPGAELPPQHHAVALCVFLGPANEFIVEIHERHTRA